MHIRQKIYDLAPFGKMEKHAIVELIGPYTAAMTVGQGKAGGIRWKYTHFDSQTKLGDFTVRREEEAIWKT